MRYSRAQSPSSQTLVSLAWINGGYVFSWARKIGNLVSSTQVNKAELQEASRDDHIWLFLLLSPWDCQVSEKEAVCLPQKWGDVRLIMHPILLAYRLYPSPGLVLSVKWDIKRPVEMRHSTHSKQGWLSPLLVDSVIAERMCGARGEEPSVDPGPLTNNSIPTHAQPPGSVKSPVMGLNSATLLRNLEAALTVTICRTEDLPEPASLLFPLIYIYIKCKKIPQNSHKSNPKVPPNPCDKSR